ncbi:MAG: SDR family oxidoreductase [Hyphomicrobiales bacterium]
MNRPHEGRAALITGGAGKIGNATARLLAEGGCDIALLDKASDRLDEVCANIEADFGVRAIKLNQNLLEPDCFPSIAKELDSQFGKLDYLVNNAAFYDEMPGWGVPFAEEGYDAWLAVLRVNLLAPFFLVQALAPMLKKSGNGSIVNVSSIYAVVGPDMGIYAGTEMTNEAAYAASKGGLITLTKWLSTVLAPDVRVNTVTPGGVARGQDPTFVERYHAKTPLGRMATESDVASAIENFLSARSSYVTGQNLLVDGGWTAW